MDDIKKFIEENSYLLDSEEPLEGHFERFQQKLMQKPAIETRKKYIRLYAAASILLLTGILFFYQKYSPSGREFTNLADISTEMEETEMYLKLKLDEKYQQLTSLAKESNFSLSMVKKDLSEMDADYRNLCKDLSENPQDERIIHAMINNYNSKIELINKIIDQTNKLGINATTKTNNYEKI